MDLSFPKAELHLHLEGCIEPATLRELGRRRGLASGAMSDAELAERYRYDDFLGFLMAFKWVVQHLETPEDYGLVAARLLERLHEQGVAYAEIYFSAGIAVKRNLAVEAIFDALEEAQGRAEQHCGIRARWIVDAVRQFGPEAAEQVVRLAARWRERGVVGIGLGGSEEEGPPHLFRRAYEMARAEGLRLTVHAGETTGPEAIWEAIRELGPDRIGHGCSAVEDPTLLEYLRDRQIPVEVAVTSNYATGAVGAGTPHPVRRMFEAGLLVVINSDDPAMFHTSLNAEYQRLAERHGFTAAELRRLARNSFRAAFLTAEEKQRYLGDHLC